MRTDKNYFYLTSDEHFQIIKFLVEKRNAFIEQGCYIHTIDDAIEKISSAKLKKVKIKYI